MVTVGEIAKLVGGTVKGDATKTLSSVAKIEEASASDLCFISNKKYQHFLQSTKAGALIIDKNLESLVTHQTVIICEMPYVAFCTALITYFDYKNTYSGIHPTAIIENSAKIGKNVYIGPNVYVGRDTEIGNNSKIYANTSIYENSKIGDDTIIYSNVSIYYQSKIGNKCIIHSGSVIGSDGFGHAPLPDGTYIKIPQIGNVIIEDDVEIGSNTSIDRANMGSTIIRKGSRIDNLVQIAHGVEIGTNTVVAAQTGISGSTKIGNNVVLAGQVGLVGHITIADGVQIGAQSGVNKSIVEKGGQYSDSPHLPIKNALKSRVLYKNLPQLEQRIRELESQIKKLNTEIE